MAARRQRAIAGALLCAAFLAGFVRLSEGAELKGRRELVILNWADYLDPELIAEFEHKQNARIRQIYFAQDEVRDQMVLDADGKGYDLAIVDEMMVAPYRKHGWLAPLNESNTPNLRNISPRWREYRSQATGYAAPFAWGTLGIAYRADLVPGGLSSWKQFFEPVEPLKNKIAMTGNPTDLIGMALKALGFSANSVEAKELAAAERLLLKQKPYVQSYDYIDVTEDSPLVTGKVVASMMYNGDALTVAEFDENIKFVVPEEGGNLWLDYLVVFQKSEKKDLARALVDFLNEPEIAARVAQYAYNATPNQAAEKFLPAEFLEDPVIYPPTDIVERSELMRPLPPRAEKRRSSIFAKVAY